MKDLTKKELKQLEDLKKLIDSFSLLETKKQVRAKIN